MDEYSKSYKYWYPRGAVMDIEVTGHRSTRYKRLIKQATEFYCTKLMSKRMCNTLNVSVLFKKKLDDDEDYEAFCDFHGKEDGIRSFTIELKKGLTVRDTLTYLAHECVHVKQFAIGEMKDGTVYAIHTKWKGKVINEQKMDYWDFPWEIEAYGREKGLFSKYINYSKLITDIPFLDSKI